MGSARALAIWDVGCPEDFSTLPSPPGEGLESTRREGNWPDMQMLSHVKRTQ